MIICNDFAQGSAEWVKARLGLISASGASRLLTPAGKARTGDMPVTYRRELIAERLLGIQVVGRGAEGSYWVERGVELEPQARAWFRFQTGEAVESVGLVYRDESRRVACSPDGLVHGGLVPLELKCPAPWTVIQYVLDGVVPDAYRAQVHFQMWCMDAPYGYFAAFHPELPGLCLKVEREKVWDDAIATAVDMCLEAMDSELKRLQEAA